MEAFVKPSLQTVAVNEHVTEDAEIESTTIGIEEFQDAMYQKKIIEDYLEEYDDNSEDMTDEDYL